MRPPGEPEQAGIAAMLGLGKSTITRSLLATWVTDMKAAGLPHRVLWAVPEHALSAEALIDFRRLGLNAEIWRGRSAPDPGHPGRTMCQDNETAEEVRKHGGDLENQLCGDPAKGAVCRFHVECSWQGQKSRVAQADIVILANQAILNPLPKLITNGLALIVADEGFWQVGLLPSRQTNLLGFADSVRANPVLVDLNAHLGLDGKRRQKRGVPRRMVPDRDATETLHGLAMKVETALATVPMWELVDRAAIAATGLTAEQCAATVPLEGRRQREIEITPGMDPKKRKDALAAAAVNATLLRRMGIWRALSETLAGDADRTGRLQMAEGGDARGAGPVIPLHSRREVSATLTALPWLYLDGTMAALLTRFYLPRFKVAATIEAAIPYAKVTHIVRGWGRSNLIQHPNAGEEENARRKRFLAELCDFIVLHGGDDALVVTHQEIEDRFANLPGVRTAHFNAVRGLDTFRSVKTVFVLGRPLPGFDAHRAMALTLTGEPIPEQKPHTEVRGLLMRDASKQGVKVRVYDDPIMEAIRVAVTDGEVIQALHRARPVNRTADDPVRLFVLADVVTALPVDRILPWADVRPSIVARMLARGVALESATDAVALYPDIFTSGVEAAKKALARMKGISGTSPYDNIFIRECPGNHPTQVLYRPKGRGQQTRRAWARVSAAQVHAMLVAVLGDLAMFKFGDAVAAPEPRPAGSSEAEREMTAPDKILASEPPAAVEPVAEPVDVPLHACPFWSEKECRCRPGFCFRLAAHGRGYPVNADRGDDTARHADAA